MSEILRIVLVGAAATEGSEDADEHEKEVRA
jgi:hypothetical protein